VRLKTNRKVPFNIANDWQYASVHGVKESRRRKTLSSGKNDVSVISRWRCLTKCQNWTA